MNWNDCTTTTSTITASPTSTGFSGTNAVVFARKSDSSDEELINTLKSINKTLEKSVPKEAESEKSSDVEDFAVAALLALAASRESNFEIPAIRNIAYCDKPGKEKVIVVFADDTKIIKNMVKGDTFDLNVGVALCIAERMFGSKTKYHKMIASKLPKKKEVVE